MDAPALDDFRAGVRRFVEREVAPHVDAWDEAGEFPRALYRRAAALGLLALGYPEPLGGTPCDLATRLVAVEEIARAGSGGLLASLFSHNIALPPLLAAGSAALQQRVIPPVLAGEQIAALAVTEPGGGSDVARLACTARLDADTVPDAETVADLCLLKNHATATMQACADAAVQMLGGMGYMRGTKSERIYRDVKVTTIGGGTDEIMKELAARQLGV